MATNAVRFRKDSALIFTPAAMSALPFVDPRHAANVRCDRSTNGALAKFRQEQCRASNVGSRLRKDLAAFGWNLPGRWGMVWSRESEATMIFLPDAGVLLTYSLACVVLFITPGPDMSLFLAKTLAGGRRAGMASMLGAMTGCCVHTLLAALGLSALLAASVTAFTVLKIVGALYLLWLAIEAVRHGSALNVKDDERGDVSFGGTFLVGVGINLTNPKVVLFFVTFLPQFVQAGDPHAADKLVFLGLYFVALTAPMGAAMILGAEKVIALLRGRPRLMRAVDYSFAGLFSAFALKILSASAR
jgi:threonine/homoserine/homoserine lactone efflux protein